MAKKKKGRSVKKNTQQQNAEPDDLVKAPHSFVIHRGIPGDHIVELTKDFRRVMEPFTAASLKEHKKNSIKDFVSIAGVFHVSHMCVFSRTELGMYMKIARMPRGPTLSFKIHNFSLARDVISSLKKQLTFEEAYKTSPLIVMNNFSGEGKHMKLMASMFQNMFPTINLTTVSLSTIRRCVLLSYNSTSKLIDFRHYIIRVVPVGVSKGVKKVVQGKIPNLGKCNDISEFFTKTAVMSESEAEDNPNAQVTLPQKLSTRGNMEEGKSAIRLSELGPRMTLQLMKVEDGLMDGEVLFHELVTKTEEEVELVRKRREQRIKEKERRKKLQNDNKEKKEKVKQELKEKSLKGMKKVLENDILMKRAQAESNEAVMGDDDDDRQYYRDEIGEEPDNDLFSSQPRQLSNYAAKFKKPKPDQKTEEAGAKKFKKQFGKKFGGDKRDKSNGDKRDKRPIGGKGKKPGGRGGHPVYGFKAQREKNDDPGTFHKVKGGKVHKKGKTGNVHKKGKKR